MDDEPSTHHAGGTSRDRQPLRQEVKLCHAHIVCSKRYEIASVMRMAALFAVRNASGVEVALGCHAVAAAIGCFMHVKSMLLASA